MWRLWTSALTLTFDMAFAPAAERSRPELERSATIE
jgi:hypothetical protein